MVDRNDFNQAKIFVKIFNDYIYFENIDSRNRAMTGDIVCVEVLDPSLWKKYNAAQIDEEPETIENHDKIIVEEIEYPLKLAILKKNPSTKIIGKVRGIITRINRAFCGYI